MLFSFTRLFIVPFLTFFLAACGGGGGGSGGSDDSSAGAGGGSGGGSGNSPPGVGITSLVDGDTFEVGTSIEFRADASDSDGSIESVTWSSDLDGEFGTGTSFKSDALSQGVHLVTVTATDDQGDTGSDDVLIEVQAAAFAWKSISTAPMAVTCGVAVDGRGYCWGAHTSVLRAAGGGSKRPRQISGDHEWRMIDTQEESACGITTADDAYCWGYNPYGNLGTGDTETQASPTIVSGGHKWKTISVGPRHTCGVTTDGDGYCWGSGEYGVLGTQHNLHHVTVPNPVYGGLEWAMIHAAERSTCGTTTDKELYCWGQGITAQGDFTENSVVLQSLPMKVSDIVGWETVGRRVGDNREQNSCGLVGASLYCWEYYRHRAWSASPFYTEPTTFGSWPMQSVSVGLRTRCGIREEDKRAYCWGYGGEGQLGNGRSGKGDFETWTEPYLSDYMVAVNGDHQWAQIAEPGLHVCGVTVEGEAYCWGEGDLGELGNGESIEYVTTPVRVLDPE